MSQSQFGCQRDYNIQSAKDLQRLNDPRLKLCTQYNII